MKKASLIGLGIVIGLVAIVFATPASSPLKTGDIISSGTIKQQTTQTVFSVAAAPLQGSGSTVTMQGCTLSGQVWTWNGSAFACATPSAGITNSAGNHVVMVSDGTNAVGSSLTDDGTTVSTTEKMHVVGDFDVNSSRFTVQASTGNMLAEGTGEVDGDFTARGLVHERYDNLPDSVVTEIMRVEIPDTGTSRSSTAGPIVALASGLHKSFDLTAGPDSAVGFSITVDSARSAGTNPLTNEGLVINISNGQNNTAINDVNGDIVMGNTANAAMLGNTSTVGLTNNTGVANFATSSSITLNDHVSNIGIPADSSHVAQIGLGMASGGGTSGFDIHTKNTFPGVSFTGVEVGGDTSVESGIRPSYLLWRGAGGIGAANEGGIAIAAGSGYPFVGMTANDIGFFMEGGGDMYLGADNSTFVPALKIKSSDNSITSLNGPVTSHTYLQAGGLSGSKWTPGTGAPGISCAIGDLFSRTDGSTSTTLYVCTASNTWTAK